MQEAQMDTARNGNDVTTGIIHYETTRCNKGRIFISFPQQRFYIICCAGRCAAYILTCLHTISSSILNFELRLSKIKIKSSPKRSITSL